jgi:catechol 2,3-dioxygenase-like lactoylglutathione lyase family enzyme
MKIEHIAFNVSDPVAVADWYCRHLGLRVVRYVPVPAQTHFLTDTESTVLEVYCNPPDAVPDYRAMNPLTFHLAFQSQNPATDSKALVAAGATIVEEIFPDPSSHLVMMRDPWGIPLQLCKRSRPLLLAR